MNVLRAHGGVGPGQRIIRGERIGKGRNRLVEQVEDRPLNRPPHRFGQGLDLLGLECIGQWALCGISARATPWALSFVRRPATGTRPGNEVKRRNSRTCGKVIHLQLGQEEASYAGLAIEIISV